MMAGMTGSARAERYRKARSAVDAWNLRYSIGACVTVIRDDGSILETVTRACARLMPSGVAVIWVEGIAGCYLLSRVRPIDR